MRTIGMVAIAACLHASGHLRAADFEQCGRATVQREAGTATATDLRLACEAVSDGVEFLRSQGIDIDGSLRVTVVDEFPSRHGIDSLGQFDPKTGEIRILSLAGCLTASAGNPPFGIPMTVEVCRSVIVHEVIHAITHDALAAGAISRLYLEYLAYVGQLASLSDDVRAQLIAASGVEGFQRDEQINDGVYFADPNRFGIMCYLHYRRPENGDAFVRKILGR